jgi:hypothetical protein
VALLLTLIGLGLVCGAIYPLAKWSASEIFLLDQPQTLKLSEPTVPKEDLRYVLALEPVGSSTPEWLAQELSKETVQQPIKLQTMTNASEAVKMAGLRWRDQRKAIVIEDFEYRADDPKFNEEKLGLLEKLVFTGNCPILIISAVDPLFYLRSSDSRGRSWASGPLGWRPGPVREAAVSARRLSAAVREAQPHLELLYR